MNKIEENLVWNPYKYDRNLWSVLKRKLYLVSKNLPQYGMLIYI